MTGDLASIVLPTHNQADHLRSVVEDYVSALERARLNFEIVLVPNACRDETPAVARALAERHARVRVVETERGGWGHAVKTGLAAARGDLLCYTNSARTGSEDLTLLLLYAVAHPNIVIKANRKIRDHWARRLGSLLYNLECRALFDLACWDVNGTPKVFPRAMGALLGLSRDDDLIDAEFAFICRREGYPMLEVPIFSTRRHGGKSTTNLQSAANMYVGAYRMWREQR
jgi:glycosyltransferase involved in cell wall biosynthesis